MRIRQPIASQWSVLLGVLSIFLLVAAYTILASVRLATKVTRARGELQKVEFQVRELESKLQLAGSSPTPVDPTTTAGIERDLKRLQNSLRQRTEELSTIEDRSVPTWDSLYNDGLLRVLRPQGLQKNEYWLHEDCIATGKRLGGGLLLSVVFSVIVGLAMGCYAAVEAFLVPPLSFLAKIPPTAMLAVFFVLVGTTYPMYVAMITFGTLPTLAQAIYQAAKKDVPDELIDKAYTLGASQMELIWSIVFRQVLPRLIDAIRLQIGPAMVLLIAAEWAVAGVGIGYRLRLFFNRTDMTVVFVYLIFLGVAGLVIDYALIGLRRRLCPWFGN